MPDDLEYSFLGPCHQWAVTTLKIFICLYVYMYSIISKYFMDLDRLYITMYKEMYLSEIWYDQACAGDNFLQEENGIPKGKLFNNVANAPDLVPFQDKVAGKVGKAKF